jgi:phosphate transport system permease protein
MAVTTTTADAVARRLTGKKIRWGELAFEGILLLALLMSLLVLVTLLADTLVTAMPVLSARGWDFVSAELSSNPETAGVGTSILGSLALTGIVAIFAFPAGIGTAIYLEEYARDTWFTRFIRTNIRNLAGVPSIVYGILGFSVFAVILTTIGLGGPGNGKNVLAGGITLAALVLPITIITTSEALTAVPKRASASGRRAGK